MGLYITGALNTVLSPEHQKEIVRYLYNHQNEDGGWGLQIEGHSTVFGSTFSYITLRLLGEGPEDGEDKAMARGRRWILDHGGAVGTLSWGKFWLTVLGVYDWEGLNPIPPELWLLPEFFPVHPAKMMCYCRLFYMTMSYLYGKRVIGAITPLVHSLREELYTQPYHQINWIDARNTYAKKNGNSFLVIFLDSKILTLSNLLHCTSFPIFLTRFINQFTKIDFLAFNLFNISERGNIRYSLDIFSYIINYCQDIHFRGCFRKFSNLKGSGCNCQKLHGRGQYSYLFQDMHKNSFGSQTWDGALAVQAILSSNLAEEYGPTLKKAHDFIKASQVQDNPSGDFVKMHRHISKGCWTFSMQDHGWQVSDCTAEGLKAALLLGQLPLELVGEKLETAHAYDAVNVILSLQSKNGGFPAWEPVRAYRWMEKFNPTDFLEDVLIEREYVECTSSAIQALSLFKKLYPGHRKAEVESCISRAIDYIENEQEDDGSWYGRWGICYTYGTWFAVEALVACGRDYDNSSALRKACKFLLSKQLPDGGWGESYLSCSNEVYTNLEGNRSNLVQTSWALLGLVAAGQVSESPIGEKVQLR
ncbi:unnamed protein product [Coffea canephora]|uniref:Terpene cyclase/mutase family member n=1 Tax=Coffea canephora TaxID=49390 RepID=A0A068UT94_COFCA|nr:unnamed protein product [Coffea canephora]